MISSAQSPKQSLNLISLEFQILYFKSLNQVHIGINHLVNLLGSHFSLNHFSGHVHAKRQVIFPNTNRHQWTSTAYSYVHLVKNNEREWQIKMTSLACTLISALHRELLCHARTFTYPGPLIQNSFENVGFFFSFLIKFLLD